MPSGGPPIAPYILYNHVTYGQALTTPFWLQYLGGEMRGSEVVARMSDGTHYMDFLVGAKYAFLFLKAKVPVNDIILINEVKRKQGVLVMKEITMTKGQTFEQIGEPEKLD